MIRLAFNIFGISLAFVGWLACSTENLERQSEPTHVLEHGSVLIPIIQKEKVQGYYMFTLVFNCADQEAKEKISTYMAWVIDQAITTLYSVSYGFWHPKKPLNPAQLEKLLSREIKARLPKNTEFQLALKDFTLIQDSLKKGTL